MLASEEGSNPSSQALIVGLGGIGAALAKRWTQDDRFARVWGISRSRVADEGDPSMEALLARSTDHSESSIAKLVDEVASDGMQLSHVAITLGTLHSENYTPEKSITSLSADAMLEVHRVNAVLPMLWLSALAPVLRKSPSCRVAILSARVGSISDNRLGGWYSYRSSKAALNMAMRCAAIEFSRRAKGVKLVAYHPGTVDTGLSEPFQRGVPEGKLFSPDYAAEKLDHVMNTVELDGELSYVDWAGEKIDW